MKWLILIGLLGFVSTLSSPTAASEDIVNEQSLPSISVAEFQQMMKQPDRVIILDVRGKDEFEAGHIEGATSIPLPELPNRLAELPKEKTIVVCCRSGRRSAQAIALLRSQGYTKLLNLRGGLNEWNKR